MAEINDEIEIGILERRLLHVLGIGQMPQRARLVRVSLVYADQLHPTLARFFVEPHRVVVIHLETGPGLSRIGVAVPLP